MPNAATYRTLDAGFRIPQSIHLSLAADCEFAFGHHFPGNAETMSTTVTQQRVFNFSAGPAALPLPVLQQVQEELLCYPGAGASVCILNLLAT